ncbi:MAG: cysteine desulfurase [Firmicutes bacterium]|nr:cysteine desulfurase [Bacillota bacterium]
MNIYFDNASTTPLLLYGDDILGNPSSPHGLGIAAERKLTDARAAIAKILNCNPAEITFTSGGTESNNLALLGFAMANRRKDVTFMAQPWEHPSILEPLKFIKNQSLANVLIAPYQEWKNCKSELRLAATSHVNHETGDINDIAAVAATLKKDNHHTTILVDGVQGFCKETANLTGIDMYTFSAHKCHGPTGTGGLMARSNVRLLPLLHGGGQENKLRPGTENVHGILRMANISSKLWSKQADNHIHTAKIKTKLAELASELPNTTINFKENTSPYILNMSFLGVKGEILVHVLSERGIYVSMGAACRSRKNTKTALEAMGFSEEAANSAIRFSFSHLNTIEEVDRAKVTITECVNQLRKVLPKGTGQ